MNNTTIGFIGLGSMGQPMVRRLAAAGYTVAINDVNPQTVAALAGEQIVACASPAEVAKQASIVITMLPNSDVVEQVLCGTDGILSSLPPGAIVIDMTSGAPSATQAMAETLRAQGSSLVDAPVSGGVTRAESGDLSIMFGGDDSVFEKVKPVLLSMGTSLTRTGGVGTAHAMKALNNLVSAGGFLIGIEALAMGKRFGLDPEVMVDVLNASTGMNNSTQKKFKQFVLSGKYNAGFGLDLMVKDLGIALGMDANQTADFSRLCLQTWQAAAESLGRGADHTEVAKYVIQRSGVLLN